MKRFSLSFLAFFIIFLLALTVMEGPYKRVFSAFTSEATTTEKTGGIFIKKVGSDLRTGTAPLGIIAYNDGYMATPSSTSLIDDLKTGDYKVNTAINQAYTISFATCQYPVGGIACTITESYRYQPIGTTTMAKGYYSLPIDVKAGMITKVVFKYIIEEPVESKTTVKVYVVGSDMATSSAPSDAEASLMTIPEQKFLPSKGENPKIYGLSAGVLGFAATNTPSAGYSVSAGVCKYSTDVDTCMPTSYSSASCDNNVCTVYLPYAPGVNQKIVYKYDAIASYDAVLGGSINKKLRSDTASNGSIFLNRPASTTIPVALTPKGDWSGQVSFSVSGLPDDTRIVWNDTACTPDCSLNFSIITSSTTPLGIYRITLTGNPLKRKTAFDLIVTDKIPL